MRREKENSRCIGRSCESGLQPRCARCVELWAEITTPRDTKVRFHHNMLSRVRSFEGWSLSSTRHHS